MKTVREVYLKCTEKLQILQAKVRSARKYQGLKDGHSGGWAGYITSGRQVGAQVIAHRPRGASGRSWFR